MVPIRSMAAVLVLLAALLNGAAASADDYDPNAIKTALLNAPIPADDSYWYPPFEEAAPFTDDVLYEVKVSAFNALVSFEIYPDAATAEEEFVEIGFPLVIDNDWLEETDSPGTVGDDLVRQEAANLRGLVLWVNDFGSGAGVCGLLGNVEVCGVSSYAVTAYATGAAGLGATRGLALVSAIGVPTRPAPPSASTQSDDRPTASAPAQNGLAPSEPGPSQSAASTGSTVMIPATDPVSVAAPTLLPMVAIPAVLTTSYGAPYRIELAQELDLDGVPGVPRAVAGYTAQEVAWILDHPDFMGGGPHQRIVADLRAGESRFLSRFSRPATVADELHALGWMDGYQRIFAFDNPPAGSAGYLDVVVARFQTPAGAYSAVTKLAADPALSNGMNPVPYGPTGDVSVALVGSEVNGTERTVLVGYGQYLVVVTAVAPIGDPAGSVDAVVNSIIATLSS